MHSGDITILIVLLWFSSRDIKTHSSKSRDQEATKHTPQIKCVATTVSYLHVGTVMQYLPELCNLSQ